MHLGIEPAVQSALGGALVSFLFANTYMAAQLVVLPGGLIGLYRRSPATYRRLRTTVVITWLMSSRCVRSTWSVGVRS